MKEILFLRPDFKYRIWGGHNLEFIYGYKMPFEKTGESWCISAHPNGPSTILNGTYKGLSLDQLYQSNRTLFGDISDKEFPLLVKIIDANDELSVQVHPDDLLARNYHSLGKTECWYILDAEFDSEIIYGHQALTKGEFIAKVQNNQWDSLLCKVKVKKGDFFYIPAGIIHALGKGILVLETQQSSDITYRLYDYNRIDKDNKTRELHVDLGISATLIPSPNIDIHVETLQYNDNKISKFMGLNYFSVEKWDINTRFLRPNKLFTLVTFIEGSGTINGQRYKKGDSCIVTSLFDIIMIVPKEKTLAIASYL